MRDSADCTPSTDVVACFLEGDGVTKVILHIGAEADLTPVQTKAYEVRLVRSLTPYVHIASISWRYEGLIGAWEVTIGFNFRQPHRRRLFASRYDIAGDPRAKLVRNAINAEFEP